MGIKHERNDFNDSLNIIYVADITARFTKYWASHEIFIQFGLGIEIKSYFNMHNDVGLKLDFRVGLGNRKKHHYGGLIHVNF